MIIPQFSEDGAPPHFHHFHNTKYPRRWTRQLAQTHGPVFTQDLAPSAYNPLMSTAIHELCQHTTRGKNSGLEQIWNDLLQHSGIYRVSKDSKTEHM